VIEIKILILISGNDSGGAATYILNICGLNDKEYDITLGCIGKGYLYEEAKKLPLRVKLFRTKSFIDKEIIKYSLDNFIDIINFNGAKLFFSYLFVYKNLKASCVATIHSDYRYDFINNKFKLMFFTPLSIMGLRKFKQYICVSGGIKGLLEDQGFKGKKYIANNGIDIRNIIINEKYKLLRGFYGIKEQDFVFVCVARFHPMKNHIKLIEAFSLLKKEYTNIKLICVGDGDRRESIEKKIQELELQDHIILTGFQKNTIEFLAAADISILTSLNEAGDPPLVILESAAARKPVICSEIGRINKIVSNEYGYLVNPNKVSDIYLKMKEAYINRNLLAEKGNEFYKFVENQFSIEGFYNKYRELFYDLVRNRRK
jgi:glycosyltransferase involved in cell wall biosynthesis